jgi:hypothetical protein
MISQQNQYSGLIISDVFQMVVISLALPNANPWVTVADVSSVLCESRE